MTSLAKIGELLLAAQNMAIQSILILPMTTCQSTQALMAKSSASTAPMILPEMIAAWTVAALDMAIQ